MKTPLHRLDSVLILELGLGWVLVLEQKLMIDSNFEISFALHSSNL
jgi:hypothetical protein